MAGAVSRHDRARRRVACASGERGPPSAADRDADGGLALTLTAAMALPPDRIPRGLSSNRSPAGGSGGGDAPIARACPVGEPASSPLRLAPRAQGRAGAAPEASESGARATTATDPGRASRDDRPARGCERQLDERRRKIGAVAKNLEPLAVRSRELGRDGLEPPLRRVARKFSRSPSRRFSQIWPIGDMLPRNARSFRGVGVASPTGFEPWGTGAITRDMARFRMIRAGGPLKIARLRA